MNQIHTEAIVLTRIDFGEADRIVTFISSDHGKLSLMAKGVRRMRSKLAGGIELFSTAEISYIKGRGDIGTLTSSRLLTYYDNIVKDIDRVQLGYEITNMLHRATEDEPGSEYFELLNDALAALNNPKIRSSLIRTWFQAQLLLFSGHTPNLNRDTQGDKLVEGEKYDFDYEDVAFTLHKDGGFSANQIKFLRLLFSNTRPQVLAKVSDVENLVAACSMLVQTMLQTYIRI